MKNCENCVHFYECDNMATYEDCLPNMKHYEEDRNKRVINMTREDLKNWTVSSYNEDTDEQLDYYINLHHCDVGDKAYLYQYEYEEDDDEEALMEMKIIHIISRMNDIEFYDELLENEDVLLDGEDEYNADTSAEFITDNDCYLVWFKYV